MRTSFRIRTSIRFGGRNDAHSNRLRSEDPDQHLKDFLKLMDSLDLDGSITTWEDLTTRFLAQFFSPGRTAKLRNDILMFQQHHGESLSKEWTHFKDLLQKVPRHDIDRWLQIQIFYDHVNPVTRRSINQSASGNSMASKSIAAISHVEREELRKKGIKSPHDLGKMTRGNEEVKEQGKEEDEMETNVEVKEVIEEEESKFETNEEVEEILEEEEEDEDDKNFNSFPTMKNLSHHECGDEYRQDEGDRRGVKHLMRLEKEMMDDKGEVT
ncbi:zinc finger, CCHC-type containing protein [Tanacetum coccineum]